MTSPFNTTGIEVYLRRFGVTTLILTGCSTTGVVKGSLQDAQEKDYDCVVVRDCRAAGTLQERETCMDIVFPRMPGLQTQARPSTPSGVDRGGWPWATGFLVHRLTSAR